MCTAAEPVNTSPSSVEGSPEQAPALQSSQDETAASQESTHPAGELTVVKVDPEKHPRNRRKRTQAGDKAVLEAAYHANPKPDKFARLEIVTRVSLNEKEVQIWFQNRRQNDRRKSRPLSPQEIAALRCGGMQIVSPQASSIPADQLCPPSTSPLVDNKVYTSPTLSRPSGSPRLHSTRCSEHYSGASPSIRESDKENRGLKVSELTSSPESGDHSPVMSQSFPGSVGYHGPRWSFGSSFSTPALRDRADDDFVKIESFSSSCSSVRSDGPVLPRPSHKIRLSFSLEGKAEIVSNEPSPPRVQPERPMSTVPTLPQFRPRTLQRSQSALPSVTLPPISALTSSLPPPRLGRGRSRDVQAWELCCDETTPDDLTRMAESESNGSALAAIKLLRSTSNTSSVLQPSGSKRNATVSKQSQRPQNAKRPKLSKSHSISRIPMAETPGVQVNTKIEEEQEDPTSKKLKVSMLVSPSGDSDKENWSPDEDGNLPASRPGRRPLPSAPAQKANPGRADRILQEQPTRGFLAGFRANTAPTASTARSRVKGGGEAVSIFEDDQKENQIPDDEVEKFMRGEVSPSKKGDADCVAGLLALSQGNWR